MRLKYATRRQLPFIAGNRISLPLSLLLRFNAQIGREIRIEKYMFDAKDLLRIQAKKALEELKDVAGGDKLTRAKN